MTIRSTAEVAANDNGAEAANDNAIAPAPGAIPTELEMENVTREIALEEDEAATGWRGLALLLVISMAAHVALFGGLGRGGHAGPAKARRPASSMRAASRYVLPSLSIDTDSVTGVVSAVAPFGRSSGIALAAT